MRVGIAISQTLAEKNSMDREQIDEVIRKESELFDKSRKDRIIIEECDSPIEDQFLWEFNKVAHHEVTVRRQFEVQTDIGGFRLDFVLESLADGSKVGVECDGRDYHSADSDAERDAAIVRTGVVNKIYRLRGSDIFCHVYDLLELLGACEPWTISMRGKVNLEARTLPAKLREDTFGEYSLWFPFAAIRRYSRPEYDPEDRDPDSRYVFPAKPIVMVWTENQKG